MKLARITLCSTNARYRCIIKLTHNIFYIHRYLYTGMVDITKSDGTTILELLIASDEMDFSDLVKFAQDYIIESRMSFIREQPAQVLRSIFRLKLCVKLRDFCLEICCRYPDNLFKPDNFLALEEDMLVLFLRRDDLRVEEVELWNYTLNWGLAKHPSLNRDPSKWSI